MTVMVRSAKLRERIADGILDAAAAVLGERGDAASMEEVAAAAGVGRATLYRYFPSRDALLQALEAAAIEHLCVKIAEAELDTVPVREGIARLDRGFLDAGGKYIALLRSGRKTTDPRVIEQRIAAPIRALIHRGVRDGTLRGDIPPDMLFGMFIALLENAMQMTSQARLGIEAASAAITTAFLTGVLTDPVRD
jgi:TetR/AcrR family transcriptional regulator, mexCD-oprJ operon repressor